MHSWRLFNLAAKNASEGNADDAIALRIKISDNMIDEERAVTANLMPNWQSAVCQWAQLLPLSKNTENRPQCFRFRFFK